MNSENFDWWYLKNWRMMRLLKACNTKSELILCGVGSKQWEKYGSYTYIPD